MGCRFGSGKLGVSALAIRRANPGPSPPTVEPDASHEVVKARIGTEAVEHRLWQFLNMHRAFPIRLLQAVERGVSIAKPRMDDGNVQRRDVSLLRQRLEFVEDA